MLLCTLLLSIPACTSYLAWALLSCQLWHVVMAPVPVPTGASMAWPALGPQGCSPTQPSSGPALAMQCVRKMEQLESNATVPVSRAGVK